MAITLLPTVVAATQLNNKFRLEPGYTRDMLLRDLIAYNEQLEARLAQIESVLVALDARLVSGGH